MERNLVSNYRVLPVINVLIVVVICIASVGLRQRNASFKATFTLSDI